MQSFLTYGVVAGVLLIIAWISISAAMREARRSGAAEANEKARKKADKVEDEMGKIQSETITMDELKDRFKKGTFGGQDP